MKKPGNFRLSVLSSGSSGNTTYVESDRGGLLIDAGLSCRRTEALLARIGRTLENVDVVLLTHGHSDHTSGLRSILRRRMVEVYAAPGVYEHPQLNPVENKESFSVCGLEGWFFAVPHDAPTYGLRLSDGSHALALATDLGELSDEVLRCMREADAVVLEANHDPDWLRAGRYPAELKRRIFSSIGHLSNYQAGEAALDFAARGMKDLVLAHLSSKNNSPARACGTVGKMLREADHGNIRVRAALVGHPTPFIEVGAPLERPEYVYRYAQEYVTEQLFEVE